MGAPKPWPTRWPEPSVPPLDLPDDPGPLEDPDYTIETPPDESPWTVPEERLTPSSVTWAVTHRCNLQCTHCYDAVDYHRSELDTAQALTIIDYLSETGITFVAFSGGEPLVRQDLFQLLERCRARNIKIALRSNGTLLTPESAMKLADYKLQVAGISLDGATQSMHDSVRGEGAYRRVRAGIESLLAMNIRVNVEVVLNQRNAHQALQFVALAEEWGVDEINFSAMVPLGRAVQRKNAILDEQTWEKVTNELYVASYISKVVVSPSCALIGPCWACVEPNITCDGWMTPCYLSNTRLFPLLETDPTEVQAKLRACRLQPQTRNNCGRIVKMEAAPSFQAPVFRQVYSENQYFFETMEDEVIG